jgi:hypothetical protein
MARETRSSWCPVVGLAIMTGVLLARDTQSAQSKVEDDVKEAFGKLQNSIKAKDAAKTWDLLDRATQADAERTAKIVKSAYKKASNKAKAKHEEVLGLKADEFAKIDGQGLLKTRPFLAKYDEIPDAKITGVTVQGDSATVNFIEPDGDKEKLSYSKKDGKWKVALPLPQFPK